MQWLTAILAFATTMLIFALIVSAIVETLHRVFRRRQTGLKRMLENFYDQVLLPHIEAKTTATPTFTLPKAEFVSHMRRVRAATKGGLISKPFRALSDLPKEAFMERLGTTKFSEIVTTKPKPQGEQLLQDIAQKYETIGAEASQNFRSWAAGWSMLIALIVAWTFYVHPYKLIETYMDDPEVAGKVAALGDASVERYERLVDATEVLQREQKKNTDTSPLTSEELAKLTEDLKTDIENARTQVDELSKAGAPIGWPDDDNSVPCQPWKWISAAKDNSNTALAQADAELAEAKARFDKAKAQRAKAQTDAELAQANAQLDKAKAQLDKAQASAGLAKARADAILAQANAQLNHGNAELDKAKAERDKANEELNKAKAELAKVNADPDKSNVDKANAAVNVLAAKVAVAKANAAQATAIQQLAHAIAATTATKPQQVEGFAFYHPKAPQDWFWLLMGGVLIGLGAPFWAGLIGQLGQARNMAGNMAEVLKPQTQPSPKAVVKTTVPVVAMAAAPAPADEIPLTSVAFWTAAEAKP